MLSLLVFTAPAAQARWRHHHFSRHFYGRPVLLPAPERARPDTARSRDTRDTGVAELVPRDWQLQPASPAWQGRRYVSPDGSAWIALYATSAANDAATRFKAVAFGDGEELTYLRGERDRLTVSGLKGDAIFYRKVMLACGGTVWRHIAAEYPAAAKYNFDGIIERMSRTFERIADDACGESVFTHPQPVSNASKPDEKPASEKPAEKPAAPN
jgi:hypothetical protein